MAGTTGTTGREGNAGGGVTLADIVAEKRKRAAEIRANLSIVPVRRWDQEAEAEVLEEEANRIEAASKRDGEMLKAALARVRELEGLLGGAADALLDAAIRRREGLTAGK